MRQKKDHFSYLKNVVFVCARFHFYTHTQLIKRCTELLQMPSGFIDRTVQIGHDNGNELKLIVKRKENNQSFIVHLIPIT